MHSMRPLAQTPCPPAEVAHPLDPLLSGVRMGRSCVTQSGARGTKGLEERAEGLTQETSWYLGPDPWAFLSCPIPLPLRLV